MSRDDDTFLGRWSRKKRSDGMEPETDDPSTVQAQPAEDDTRSDTEILEALELPDPESLKEGDDFAAFMNSAVPDHLRKRALRKLWLSNPALANLDGLVEYGEDYTDAAMVPEVLNTAYKVGRGFLKDIIEMNDDEIDENDLALEVQAEELTEQADIDAAELLSPEEDEIAHDTAHVMIADDMEPKPPPRKRMVFSTD